MNNDDIVVMARSWNVVRRNDGILPVCGCIEDHIRDVLEEYEKPEAERDFVARRCPGLEEIVQSIMDSQNRARLNDVLETRRILGMTMEYIRLYDFKPDHYVPTFIQKTWNIPYRYAMCVLCALDSCGWLEHGSGLRNPWLSDKGKKILEQEGFLDPQDKEQVQQLFQNADAQH